MFWSDNSVAKVASRTMDWQVSDDPVLWAVPEGTRRAAGDAFDEQLEHLRQYRPFGGNRPLTGGIESTDRFVRAAYFLHYLPEPKDLAEAIAGVVNIAGTVSCPPGAPCEDFGVYPTWWTSAVDLTNLTFYFWSHTSPSLIWVELSGIDLRPGSPVRALDPRDPGLVGDVTARLAPAALTY